MVRSTPLTTGAMLLPVKGTARFGLAGSLLAMVSEADAEPAADGAKRTVTSADLPGTMVIGTARETGVNAAPLLAIARTVRSAVPVLLIVSFASLVWPAVRLPKSREAGTTEMDGASPPAPAPVRATVTVARAGSLLAIDSVPDTPPGAFGEKRTVTSADCPAGIASGNAGAAMLNRGLLLPMLLTISVAAPPLLTVILRSFVWPGF